MNTEDYSGQQGDSATRCFNGAFTGREKSESAGKVELNLAKVGVEGSNPFARSKIPSVERPSSHGPALRRAQAPLAFLALAIPRQGQ